MYDYRATVLRVVDGDTLHVELDLGLDVRIRVTLRLHYINAPEMSTPEGKAVRDYVAAATQGPLYVRTHKDKREKYGRYLATVYPRGFAYPSLNSELLEAGLVQPYNP